MMPERHSTCKNEREQQHQCCSCSTTSTSFVPPPPSSQHHVLTLKQPMKTLCVAASSGNDVRAGIVPYPRQRLFFRKNPRAVSFHAGESLETSPSCRRLQKSGPTATSSTVSTTLPAKPPLHHLLCQSIEEAFFDCSLFPPSSSLAVLFRNFAVLGNNG